MSGGIFSFCHYFLMLTQFLALHSKDLELLLLCHDLGGDLRSVTAAGGWLLSLLQCCQYMGHLVALTMLRWGAESGVIPCAVLGCGWINPNANPWSSLSQEDSCTAESPRQESGLHQPQSVLTEHKARRPALQQENPRSIHMELFRGKLNLITLLI